MYGCTRGCISCALLKIVTSDISEVGVFSSDESESSFSTILPAPPSAIDTTCTHSFFLKFELSSNKCYKKKLVLNINTTVFLTRWLNMSPSDANLVKKFKVKYFIWFSNFIALKIQHTL